jgi:hypothetical protein
MQASRTKAKEDEAAALEGGCSWGLGFKGKEQGKLIELAAARTSVSPSHPSGGVRGSARMRAVQVDEERYRRGACWASLYWDRWAERIEN